MTGSNSEDIAPPLMLVLAIDAGVRGVAGLVARVLGLPRAVAARRGHEQILLEDELIARVVGRGVLARVHADGVARARLDAKAAEDAAQLVDHELIGKALVAAALVPLGVFGGDDVDALRGARRRTTEASHAPRRAVVAQREAVQGAEQRGVRPRLVPVSTPRA